MPGHTTFDRGLWKIRVVLITVALAAAGVIGLTRHLSAQAKPNFSGEWTMVADKSDFGPMPAPAAVTRTITHTGPTLKIVTVQKGGAMGDTTIETTFTTDGKAQKNTVAGNPMTTVGKWDGDALLLNSTLTQQGVDITIEDRYTLSDAGKTLTLLRKFTTPDGPFASRIVFTKK